MLFRDVLDITAIQYYTYCSLNITWDHEISKDLLGVMRGGHIDARLRSPSEDEQYMRKPI